MRYVARSLYNAWRAIYRSPNKKNPTAIVLTLAVTIGASAAIFTVVNTLLLKPLPYSDGSRLRVLWHAYSGLNIEKEKISPPSFALYQKRAEVFSALGALAPPRGINVAASPDAEPVATRALPVTPNLFATLGVRPALGRLFTPDDAMARGAPRIVIVSFSFWRTHLGAADPIVKKLWINDQPVEVVGVMPKGFQILETADIWIPLTFTPDDLGPGQHGNEFLTVIGRLRAGVTNADVDRTLSVISSDVRAEYPQFYTTRNGWRVFSTTLREELTGRFRTLLQLLSIAVLVLVIIGWINISNLLLAKAVAGSWESAVKLALGCSRTRVLADAASEVFILSIAGGALGLILADTVLKQLLRYNADFGRDVPPWNQMGLDFNVGLFALALSLLSGLVCACFPLSRMVGKSLETQLRGAARVTAGKGHSRLLNTLVALEVATACILLVAAGLLVKTINALSNVNPGFRPQQVVTFRLILPRARYSTGTSVKTFQYNLIQELERMPGIAAAGFVSSLPFQTVDSSTIVLSDFLQDQPNLQSMHASYVIASPHYFSAMTIPLRIGRVFSDHDTQNSLPIALVDDAAASRLWPAQQAVGKRIAFGFEKGRDGNPKWRQVVGVVGHVKDRVLNSDTDFQFYVPDGQATPSPYSYVVRGSGNFGTLASTIRYAITTLDSHIPLHSASPLSTIVENSFALTKMTGMLVLTFAIVAILLTLVGVYGVISYIVALRKLDIAVRMALGASTTNIMRHIMGTALTLAGVGVIIAVPASLAMSFWMQSVLFGVRPFDPIIQLGAAVIVVLVAAVASYAPAAHASNVDPLLALRGGVS